MQEITARSVVLCVLLVSVFAFLALLFLSRTISKTINGLDHAVSGAFYCTAGTVLLVARGAIPAYLSVVVGNVLLFAGLMLVASAARAYARGERYSRRTIGACVATQALLLSAANLLGTYHASFMLITFFDGMAAVAIAWAAYGHRPQTYASRAVWIMFAISAVAAFARCISIPFSEQVMQSGYEPIVLQKIYLVTVALCYACGLLALTFMTYEKLGALLVNMNAELETQVDRRTAELRQEIEHKEALEKRLASIVETERRRIGYELHDDLGQRLTGISLFAELLTQRLKAGPQELLSYTNHIHEAIGKAIGQVRALAHGLMPVGPGPEGFMVAVQELAFSVNAQQIRCELLYDEPVDVKDQDVATHLFRIAQEAVNNAIKHAQASWIGLKIDLVDGKVCMTITDNGIGIPHAVVHSAISGGKGCEIMKFRASLINYRFDMQSPTTGGTVVKVTEC
jgi:signal transduction histidine kinase